MNPVADSHRSRSALLPYLGVSLALCAAAIALAQRASDPHAASYGVGAAALSALCALPALALGAPRGTNGVLAGFLAGFFARMIAVAVGLVLSGARGGAALTYALSFFGLYALTQTVEVAYVFGSSRARRAGA